MKNQFIDLEAQDSDEDYFTEPEDKGYDSELDDREPPSTSKSVNPISTTSEYSISPPSSSSLNPRLDALVGHIENTYVVPRDSPAPSNLADDLSNRTWLQGEDWCLWRMKSSVTGCLGTTIGCVKYLKIVVNALQMWCHAYVVQNHAVRVLSARPWQKHVWLAKVEGERGVRLILHDPLGRQSPKSVYTASREQNGSGPSEDTEKVFRMWADAKRLLEPIAEVLEERGENGLPHLQGMVGLECQFQLLREILAENSAFTASVFTLNPNFGKITHLLAYQNCAQKTRTFYTFHETNHLQGYEHDIQKVPALPTSHGTGHFLAHQRVA